jgi:hypothetical protein
MKKKMVITTEKREVWVVREGIPEPPEDQTIDVSLLIEGPSPDDCFGASNDPANEEKKP